MKYKYFLFISMLALVACAQKSLGMAEEKTDVPAVKPLHQRPGYYPHNQQLAGAFSHSRDRAEFRRLMESELADLNYCYHDWGQGEGSRPLWQAIREWHCNTDSPWLADLREYEARRTETPQIQLEKAVADLDYAKVSALLLSDSILDVNHPLMLLFKFTLYHIKANRVVEQEEREAIKITSLKLLELLLKSPTFDISKCVKAGGGIVHAAVATPHLLASLLAYHDSGKLALDIDSLDDNNNTPLIMATLCSLESAELLAKRPNAHLNQALRHAIHATHNPTIMRDMLYCLAERKAFVETATSSGKTLLAQVLADEALIPGDPTPAGVRIVYALLALGASLKLGAVNDRYSELMNYEALPMLQLADDGTVPSNHQLLYSTFCRRRALLDERFQEMLTHHPLDRADAQLGDPATYLNRLDESVDVNEKDATGLTSLHWAAARGAEELTSQLLALPGMNPCATDWRGNTALHYAARNGQAWAAKRLLESNGVSIEQRNNAGLTAQQMAQGQARAFFKELNKRRRQLFLLALHGDDGTYLPKEICLRIAQYLHL